MTHSFEPRAETHRALVWLISFSLIGIILVLLYPDADQQDSGNHYLLARAAWRDPHYFVDVWARPLFTFIYSFPAQLGYPGAKIFTLLICLATGWQSFRLAQWFKIENADLVIPILFLQPSFFLLCSAVFTEPLFALFLTIALRLHLSGRVVSGILTTSLLILIRPEGFFIGILWGLWILIDQSGGRGLGEKIGKTALLASGMVLWWLASYLITRDPLWIAHNWPAEWNSGTTIAGPIYWYIILLPLIIGPFLLPQFFAGIYQSIKRRDFRLPLLSFVSIFVLHSLLYSQGLLGSPGFARYIVPVSPVIALITLIGWNALAEKMASLTAGARRLAGASVIGLSVIVCFVYVDGWQYSRDAVGIEELKRWFDENRKPVANIICSQAYMRIAFDSNLGGYYLFKDNRERNLELIRLSSAKTLIFWDNDVGPKWFGIDERDFESAGFSRLKSQTFNLKGNFFTLSRSGYGGVRNLRLHLFYKE
jgi:hypothetical protein